MIEIKNQFNLEGKRVLITGASSGIGIECVNACSQMGAQVIACARDIEKLENKISELKIKNTLIKKLDINNDEEISDLIKSIDPIDSLVHSAGVSKLAPFRMTSRSLMEELFKTNIFSPVFLTKELYSQKKLKSPGSIIFISGMASHLGPVGSTAYASSKSALLGAMRSISRELAPKGIRVNCISPGYVHTPILESIVNTSEKALSAINQKTPLGIGKPSDIASAVVFFLSDASRWITSEYFVIDGGLTIPSTGIN